MYKISIIVPVYNSEKYIKRCIDSLTNQDYENVEIIIVNDGSTDSSLSICEELQKKSRNVKVYNIKNGGVSNARNYGLSKSKGDYILFVDSDDYIKSNCIKECMNIIEKNNLDILKFNYYRQEKNTLIKNVKYPILNKISNKDYKEILFPYIFNSGNFSNIWSSIIKRDLCINIKFDKKYTYGEDFLFFINCFLKSKNIEFINKYFYYYSINEGSITNTFKKEHCIKKINDCFSVNEQIQEKLKENGYTKNLDYLNNSKFMFENELKNVLKKNNVNLFIEFVNEVKLNEKIMFNVKLFYNNMSFVCKNLFIGNRFFCQVYRTRYIIKNRKK